MPVSQYAGEPGPSLNNAPAPWLAGALAHRPHPTPKRRQARTPKSDHPKRQRTHAINDNFAAFAGVAIDASCTNLGRWHESFKQRPSAQA